MGIGNHGIPRRPGINTHLITPHGDREPSFPVAADSAVETHYPSWGSGTLPGSTGRKRMFFSLPLMGIGNHRHARGRPRQHELITPHGDRELVAGRQYGGGLLIISLPLMGIGNPLLRLPVWVSGAEAHYPSWGSGTRRRSPSSGRSTTHYPSWGSGTRTGPHCRVNTTPPHYPSWGSGTLHRETGCKGLDTELITPHGDRELPLARGASAAIKASSLPLMGIGNWTSLCRRSAPTRSHYPSWGSGTHIEMMILARPTATHYPSWGSGT